MASHEKRPHFILCAAAIKFVMDRPSLLGCMVEVALVEAGERQAQNKVEPCCSTRSKLKGGE
jgi:hypothetical protein